MRIKPSIYTWVIACALTVSIATGCTSGKVLSAEYYRQHEQDLVSIKDRFKKMHRLHPFSLEIRDKDFRRIGLEIITDTIRYMYHFELAERDLPDTLRAYRFAVPEMTKLIRDMQDMHCTWVTNLDYYENGQEKYMVFLSLRHKKLGYGHREKYFTIVFFDQQQYFDQRGRLLDREDRRLIRKINGETFYKINDRVCFTVSDKFR